MLAAGLPPHRRLAQLLALTGILLGYSAQLAGALAPHAWLFVTATAAGLALDLYLEHRQPGLLALLAKVRFDVPARQLLRDILLIMGLVRLPGIDPLEERPLAVALLGCYLAHFTAQAVALLVRRSRWLPVLTRNIDTSELGLTPAPPVFWTRRPGRRLLCLIAPTTAGLLVTVVTGAGAWGALGLAITLTATVGGTGYLASWLLPGKRPPAEAQVLRWLDRWLAEHRPTVGMYFSGGTTSAYQANMWLTTLAALDGRPLIVLRERYMVQRIDATDVPIVCIPKVAHLMRLEHSSLRVLLHPANSGKTSQVLRIPTIKHAFINHGESDKLSSCNPYAKAYDEVWVAGPAARDRYRAADIGVDDRDVVEVGRPQLAPILPHQGAPSGAYTTVLYAPTWEGWTEDPGNTSIILAGEHLVRRLLADPAVRLLYRPHPLTGSVDPRAGQADARIRALIEEAIPQRATGPGDPEAFAELERRSEELRRTGAVSYRRGADDVERMLRQGAPDRRGRPTSAELQAATTAWEEAYWAALPQGAHQVVTGARPGLYSCFNQTHLLISDVSSVVADYLSSQKPYAVVNTSGLDPEVFREGFPTVRAATVLGPHGEGVEEVLAAVRDPARDTMAAARDSLKVRLLGPSEPPSLVRFNAAAQALGAAAERRRERIAAHAGQIPDQRETVLTEGDGRTGRVLGTGEPTEVGTPASGADRSGHAASETSGG